MNETARRCFHILFGTALAALAYYELVNVYQLSALLAFAFILSQICKKQKLPIIHPLLELLERKENLATHPGIGAIAFLAGSILALIIFPITIATTAILILSWGDGVSGLAGRYGKNYIHNPKKNVEGTIAGIIAATAAAATITPLLPAITASALSMTVESLDIQLFGVKIDDNLIIPVLSGAIISIF